MKPCPFCQQNLEWDTDLSGFVHPVESFCVSSGLLIEKTDVDRWNTRIPDPMLEELAGALENTHDSVCELIDSSRGVCGLHLNGDVATWDELRTGGKFEGWLIEFDDALQVLQKYQKSKVQS